MNYLSYFWQNPGALAASVLARFGTNLSDEHYVKLMYFISCGKLINLKKPKLFTEKLQWIKLYYHDPLYTKLVDKYEVKKYVADKIGEQCVVPLYGVWDRFEDIDFDSLPEQFVLKTTHSSGGFAICKDKDSFDIQAAKERINRSLNHSYYLGTREWPYKNVKPRIIAEKYMPSVGNADSEEYKLTCINGEVKVFTVCRGVPHDSLNKRFNDHFSRDFQRQNWYAYYKSSNREVKRPDKFDEMIEIAEKLSAGIPHVRVDLYVVDGQVYFGEMTFFTWAGFIRFNPKKQDEIMGVWLTLPEHKIL